jgi:bla regulator protein blaR1
VLAVEGLVLIAVAVALAVPVPAALAAARWPARAPRAALVAWQAVGLGGGLALLGAGLTLAVSGLHRSWLHGVAALPSAAAGPGLGPLGWAGAVLTVAAGAWLAAVAVVSTVRLLTARRQHRRRLDLLADERPAGELAAGLAAGLDRQPIALLDHPAAAAYCLPGVRPRIVLSQGTVDALSADQLTAVVRHERAHARGQHDLVIAPFRAWQQTFPFLAAARRALAAVELLVEMLADDAAARGGDRAAQLSALRALAAVSPGDAQVSARLARLAGPPPELAGPATVAVYAAAVALVALPPLVLLAS